MRLLPPFPHETAFVTLFLLTGLRLAVTGNWPMTLPFAAGILLMLPPALGFASGRPMLPVRMRLLSAVWVIPVVYWALAPVAPVIGTGNGPGILMAMDKWLGGDALNPWLDGLACGFLTDFLSAVYMSLFPLLAVTGIWKYLTARDREWIPWWSGLLTVYALGYAGYTLVPAAGPAADGLAAGRAALSGGWLTQSNMAMIRLSNGVDCMPSLHVALPAYFFCWEFQGQQWTRALIFLIFSVLIAWATVYLRQHYLVDILLGAPLGLLMAFVFRRAAFRLIEKCDTSGWKSDGDGGGITC